MRRVDLARQLIAAANNAGRKALLNQYPHLADIRLARILQRGAIEDWPVNPARARRAATVLNTLLNLREDPTIRGLTAWIDGLADITTGKFDRAIEKLDAAADHLRQIGETSDAAQTRVAKLLALGMVGRYDEAIKTGRSALLFLARQGDHLAAGKIEMNLSNIVSRQAHHRDAERYCLSARRRFIKAHETSWQAMAENGLANTYAELNDFNRADRYYRLALDKARATKMQFTEAEIEASLGNLALLRGRYSDALRSFELSRQKFEVLGIAHQSAIADLEIADIYLELNLADEASEIYARVAPVFHRLRLRAEEGRARLNFGRAAAKLGDQKNAKAELRKALRLFALEKNRSGLTSVMVAQAALAIATLDHGAAAAILTAADRTARQDENPRRGVDILLLRGEAYRQARSYSKAARSLTRADSMARKQQYLAASVAALNSLGKVAIARRDTSSAKSFFRAAIRGTENLRANVAADEFSISFLASRLEPYQNLTRLLIAEGKPTQAFAVLESGRSRALLAAIDGRSTLLSVPPKLRDRSAELRAELNYYYKRLDSSPDDELDRLRTDIKRTESALADASRKLNSLLPARTNNRRASHFNSRLLQEKLGSAKTLIEYVEFDGRISAFVLNGRGISYTADLAATDEINRLMEDLHFQFGATRYAGAAFDRFAEIGRGHTDRYLSELYDRLLKPLEAHLEGEAVVIVPVGSLHYVPFQALRSDESYLVERFEISYAPSAEVWMRLQERKFSKIQKPLLVGFADEKIPLVEQEINEITKVFPQAVALTGEGASFSAFIGALPRHDLIHLACHGKFRPENPRFSSLHLADGWVTVHDIYTQPLSTHLITLSTCETGLSKAFAGDEMLGLTRGFLVAGAASLVVSLWTVNDAATGALMTSFYEHLQRGISIASSLREAQRESIGHGGHPYHWAPFVLIGQ